ncbi:hypothetical protein ARC310_02890 [Pantoea ananatis]|nr:hypothetical protein ARC311_06990 [Pantoea ananatis]PZD68089.1 hypothetical protein ARC310_02890 [Pantoea ananatis]
MSEISKSEWSVYRDACSLSCIGVELAKLRTMQDRQTLEIACNHLCLSKNYVFAFACRWLIKKTQIEKEKF